MEAEWNNDLVCNKLFNIKTNCRGQKGICPSFSSALCPFLLLRWWLRKDNTTPVPKPLVKQQESWPIVFNIKHLNNRKGFWQWWEQIAEVLQMRTHWPSSLMLSWSWWNGACVVKLYEAVFSLYKRSTGESYFSKPAFEHFLYFFMACFSADPPSVNKTSSLGEGDPHLSKALDYL